MWLSILVAVTLGLPATAATAAPGTATVRVHFSTPGGECDATRAFPRRVATPRVLTAALEQLLAGPTAAERSATATMFSSETAGMLRSVTIRHGVAHVDLRDLRTVIPNASTSCGSTSLLAQLDATTTQFPTVHRARYSIDGSEPAFYHWLQRDVPPRSAVTATRGSLTNTAAIHHDTDRGGTLRGVRVGRHDGFDRLVLEFEGDVPTYHVEYASVARTGGAGQPIPVQGTSAVQIVVFGWTVDLERPGFPRTYEPALPLTPRYPTLRQVADGGAFEGVAVFAAGVRARTGFRVMELTGPSRLVIDVAHGAQVRTLQRGHRGPDVRDWQERLNTVQHGDFATSPSAGRPPLRPDGIYGPATQRATRVLQDAEGVAVTGVVDAATRAAMDAALRRAGDVRP